MTRQEEIAKAFEKALPATEGYTPFFGEKVAFRLGAEWADANPKSPWISVEDDLPYNNPNNIHFGFTNRVLATDGKNILVAYMRKNKDNKWIWWSEDNVDITHIITHWMPFPKPPKE